MGRPKSGARLLKQTRSGNDIWYIHELVNGKRTRISTGETDKTKAQEKLDAYKAGDKYAEVQALDSEKSTVKAAAKVADRLVEKYSGTIKRTPIETGHDRWVELTPGHADVSEGTKSFYRTIWRRFAEWCKSEGVDSIEAVDHEIAALYATHLWNQNTASKTYNDYLKHLSRVFSKLDNIGGGLPCRDPFNKDNVARKRSKADTASHKHLEPDELVSVLEKSAEFGEDIRDLFFIGANTGMRLKDACLLKWEFIDGDFIRFIPHKTSKTSAVIAHVPISSVLASVLERRGKAGGISEYVLPEIAECYMRDRVSVNQRTQAVFDAALNTSDLIRTRNANPDNRKRATCVIGFHSLRVTFMSLLAARDVSIRDAQRIFGWSSSSMVELYTKFLEKFRAKAEDRARKAVASIEELQMDIPEVPETPVVLHPTEEALNRLVQLYSNITLAQIYGNVTEAAVRKWLKKFGIKRQRRIESELDPDELERVRAELLEELKNG